METTIKYDKKVVIKCKHDLYFKENTKLIIGGNTYLVKNCYFDGKKTYKLFLKFYDNTFAKLVRQKIRKLNKMGYFTVLKKPTTPRPPEPKGQSKKYKKIILNKQYQKFADKLTAKKLFLNAKKFLKFIRKNRIYQDKNAEVK